jgi:hypothetical protein
VTDLAKVAQQAPPRSAAGSPPARGRASERTPRSGDLASRHGAASPVRLRSRQGQDRPAAPAPARSRPTLGHHVPATSGSTAPPRAWRPRRLAAARAAANAGNVPGGRRLRPPLCRLPPPWPVGTGRGTTSSGPWRRSDWARLPCHQYDSGRSLTPPATAWIWSYARRWLCDAITAARSRHSAHSFDCSHIRDLQARPRPGHCTRCRCSDFTAKPCLRATLAPNGAEVCGDARARTPSPAHRTDRRAHADTSPPASAAPPADACRGLVAPMSE